jgi:signal transduction protein with GAF and PtsI domain
MAPNNETTQSLDGLTVALASLASRVTALENLTQATAAEIEKNTATVEAALEAVHKEISKVAQGKAAAATTEKPRAWHDPNNVGLPEYGKKISELQATVRVGGEAAAKALKELQLAGLAPV